MVSQKDTCLRVNTPFHSLANLDFHIFHVVDEFLVYEEKLWNTHNHWFVAYGLSKEYKEAIKHAACHGDLPMIQRIEHVCNGVKNKLKKQLFRIACKHGHLHIARYFESQCVCVKTKRHMVQSDRHKAIKNAALNGNLEVVKYLLLLGADIDMCIYYACMNSRLCILEYLVSVGVSMCRENNHLRTAIIQEHFEVVKYLISCVDDVESRRAFILGDDNDNFFLLCSFGRLDMLKYLMSFFDHDGKLDIIYCLSDRYMLNDNIDSHFDDVTMLCCAALNGHLHVVKYLLSFLSEQQQKYIIEWKNNYAIRCASANYHSEVVQYLKKLRNEFVKQLIVSVGFHSFKWMG